MQSDSNIQSSDTNGRGAGLTPAATNRADGSLSGAPLEFHNFLADIEDLIKATTSLTGEDLMRAKAKLAERVAIAKKSVEAMSGAIIHRTRKTAEVTNNYVHEQPWKAVGIGAAVGVLLGFVLARRK